MYRLITRFDPTTGQMVTVQVPADYQLQNGEQFVETNETQQTQVPEGVLTRDQVNELLNKARQEERAKLQSSLQREKDERAKLQKEQDEMRQRLDTITNERRQQEINALKPDERRDREFKELQQRFEEQQRQLMGQVQQLQQQSRAAELAAYRAHALRQYGTNIIPDLVIGQSEEEIDQAADRAAQMYQSLQQQVRQNLEREYAARGIPLPQSTPTAVSPPPNPAYVPPVPGQFVQQGLPSVVNAGGVVNPEQTGTADIAALTTEEAVRSGRWGGEVRQQILNQLKQGGNVSVPLGTQPRYMTNVPAAPVVNLPGGVTQPQGYPSVPAYNPNMVQGAPGTYPQVQSFQAAPGATPAPVQGDPRAAALQAVQRTHQGSNPVLGQMPSSQAAVVRQAVQQGQANGVDSATAFANRFQPTPPISA